MRYYKLDGTDLSFEYPDYWNVSKEENVISLFDSSNGVGALQFSIYQKNDKEPISLREALEEFVSMRHQHYEIVLMEKFAYCVCLDKKDTIWRYWLFQKSANIIFASYNCPFDDGGKEDAIIDKIVMHAIKESVRTR